MSGYIDIELFGFISTLFFENVRKWITEKICYKHYGDMKLGSSYWNKMLYFDNYPISGIYRIIILIIIQIQVIIGSFLNNI